MHARFEVGQPHLAKKGSVRSGKPSWLKVRLPSDDNFFRISRILRSRGLHTICESGRCPNIGECWSRKTATFLVLGDICTRNCGFCAVSKGRPSPLDPEEPGRVAEAVEIMGLRYAVITSVTRDDLEDGGAAHFTRVIHEVRARNPRIRVEVLVPDFGGNGEALDIVLGARPDVLNHNLETAEGLYPVVRRPKENYRRSLELIARAKKMGARTKSGLMLGLGETPEELRRTLKDLRAAGCDLLTLGQYLRPGPDNTPVLRYYSPQEFSILRTEALSLGFLEVASGPLVRSSYEAERLHRNALER